MKKSSILILALVLALLLAAVGQATGTPSITAEDLQRAPIVQPVNPPAVPVEGEPFHIDFVENTEEVEAVLEGILKFTENNAFPIVDFFDYDEETGTVGEPIVKERILALLPEGFDPETLVMNELITAQPFAYNEAIGDVIVAFAFATPYEADQVVVAVAGIFDAQGRAEWIPLEARVEADEDGMNRVKILFTMEALQKMDNEPFALAILSE